MVEVNEYDRNETIRLENTFTDIDDVVYDPTTVELRIYDPTGALLTTVTYAASEIIQVSTGIYYYNYNIATDALLGQCVTKWIGNGSFTDVTKNQFRVRNLTDKLYCTVEEVWNRAGVDSNVASKDEIVPLIRGSMAEIDAMYAKSFLYGTEKTEWFDTVRADPKVRVTNINLNYKPVIVMTSIEEYDTDNNLITTHDPEDYWLNKNTGRITLLDKKFAHQTHRVKVVYSYGYTEIPQKISELCVIFSAIRLLTHQIGMQYDDVTSWSACGLSVGVGEPYTSMARAIEFLLKDKASSIAAIGRLRPSAFVL